MTLKEQIVEDLSNAIRNKKQTNNLKVIVGEIQRLQDKDPDDNVIIKILRKLVKSEKEQLKYIGDTTSEYLQIVESYIPKQETVSEEEIIKWIQNNINFEDLKSKLSTIKIILGHFNGRTDGKTVKKILMEKF